MADYGRLAAIDGQVAGTTGTDVARLAAVDGQVSATTGTDVARLAGIDGQVSAIDSMSVGRVAYMSMQVLTQGTSLNVASNMAGTSSTVFVVGMGVNFTGTMSGTSLLTAAFSGVELVLGWMPPLQGQVLLSTALDGYTLQASQQMQGGLWRR